MAQTDRTKAAGSKNTRRSYRSHENPEFFSDSEILRAIVRIIERAEQRISIVSPYNDFPLPGLVSDALELAAKRNVPIRAICRKDRAKEERGYWDWLSNLGAEVYLVNNLHAKIYCNESYGIITSMNLLKGSVVGSKEVGIGLTELDRIHNYVNSLTKHDKFAPSKPKTLASPVAEARPKPSADSKGNIKGAKIVLKGSCIGCSKEVDYDTKRPRCIDCHNRWDGNKNRPENYCHGCGQEKKAAFGRPICFSRPLCSTCYKEAASAK